MSGIGAGHAAELGRSAHAVAQQKLSRDMKIVVGNHRRSPELTQARLHGRKGFPAVASVMARVSLLS